MLAPLTANVLERVRAGKSVLVICPTDVDTSDAFRDCSKRMADTERMEFGGSNAQILHTSGSSVTFASLEPHTVPADQSFDLLVLHGVDEAVPVVDSLIDDVHDNGGEVIHA